MILALTWALGQVAGTPHLPLEWMVATHGVANALGFALCGLLAFRRLSLPEGATPDEPGRSQPPAHYDTLGSTRSDPTPPGYHRLYHRARLGDGDEVFRRAAEALMTLADARRGGPADQATDSPRARLGANSLGGSASAPRRTVPCRVIWTVDEPDRIGFAYGTLEGHPAAGEEAFRGHPRADGIYFTLRAYSRAGTWYTRLGGPATRNVQAIFARRYTTALRRLATR